MSEQRRLAAIVSADVAGYSRLMGRDEGGTLAALKALRQEVIDPAISRHGGRIVKTTGDGLLLEFPSVVNAVRCAVEVQVAVADRSAEIAEDQRIAFRVGINIGDIIVEGDDIFGDGVNVAARLQEIAAPGGICVSTRVHEDVRDRLDTAFDDGGTQTLKNIARPVQVWRWHPGTAVPPKPPSQPTALPLPDKPSIAVLPFQNMSSDPEQEYFADGMVEDIITGLSRIRWLFVIARNSSFTYKGRAVDVKHVGRELGVRYVLEGSVRKSGGRIRVTAQLIEADSGTHLWAERYDRSLDDIFAVQDEITDSVISVIEPTMAEVERQRAKRKNPESLNTWELYHRGLWHIYQFTNQDNRVGTQLLQKAAASDSSFGAARSALALAYYFQGWLLEPLERAKWRPLSLDHARIAADLDPLDSTAHAVFGLCLLVTGQREASIKETALGVSLNPNNATLHGFHGTSLAWSGQSREGLVHLNQASRLSPLDPLRWYWAHASATACYFLGDYEACVSAGQDCCRMRPDLVFGYRALVAGLAELSLLEEARRIGGQIYDKFPNEMTAFLKARWPEWREIDYARYVASLAKGGLSLADGRLTRVT